MKNLINHFRNSILAVFFTALPALCLIFYDVEFVKLALLILSVLPLLLFLDFCLWIVFYKEDKEEDIIDLELLQKELNKEKNKIYEVSKEQGLLPYGRQ